MAENKKLLILRLEGALQSWGENSKWDHRDTSVMPSKSGIVGLLGCALGKDRNSPELIQLSQNMKLAIRADRPGIITTDFQTVLGRPLMTASGKPKPSDANTIVSPRDYINDGCFTVFLEMSEDWLDRVTDALQTPKWCIFLGRKCCVPSRPVFEAVCDTYSSLMEAVENYPAARRAVNKMLYECDADSHSAEIYRPDELAENRQFDLRKVRRGIVEAHNVSD